MSSATERYLDLLSPKVKQPVGRRYALCNQDRPLQPRIVLPLSGRTGGGVNRCRLQRTGGGANRRRHPMKRGKGVRSPPAPVLPHHWRADAGSETAGGTRTALGLLTPRRGKHGPLGGWLDRLLFERQPHVGAG